MINVQTATTAELVAFYNANVAVTKQIKKFADRATAEKRVAALNSVAPIVESNVYGFEIHGHANCPSCGIDLRNGVSQHGDDVNGKPLRHDTHEFECMGCGAGFGDLIKRAKPSLSRRAGIAASWAVPEVAAARSERTGTVSVAKGDKVVGHYRSVAHAYTLLGMSLKGHIQFRMALKVERTKDLGAYTFTIA